MRFFVVVFFCFVLFSCLEASVVGSLHRKLPVELRKMAKSRNTRDFIAEIRTSLFRALFAPWVINS